MSRAAQIAPSILAANFADLGAEVSRIESQISLLHVDVMDGHFVPAISFGAPIIASLRNVTTLYLDCHLMVTDPFRHLEPLVEAGINGATAHIEAIPSPTAFLDHARSLGIDAGLAINPATPIEAIEPFLSECSKVLVMSVNPGYGGQTFIDASLAKIRRLREIIDSEALATDIGVDGGIDLFNVGQVASAGADVIVAGTSVFRTADPLSVLGEMRTNMMNDGDT